MELCLRSVIIFWLQKGCSQLSYSPVLNLQFSLYFESPPSSLTPLALLLFIAPFSLNFYQFCSKWNQPLWQEVRTYAFYSLLRPPTPAQLNLWDRALELKLEKMASFSLSDTSGLGTECLADLEGKGNSLRFSKLAFPGMVSSPHEPGQRWSGSQHFQHTAPKLEPFVLRKKGSFTSQPHLLGT